LEALKRPGLGGKEPSDDDYRLRFAHALQQIAMVDTETGELVERRLEHESGEARGFYAGLKGAVRAGIEATGHTHWFEAMLSEFGHELWMGDAGCPSIRAKAVAVSRTKFSCRCVEHRFFRQRGLRTKTLEISRQSLAVVIFSRRIVPPTIDSAQTSTMILLCEHPAPRGMRERPINLAV